jgi:hypothetical protein
MSELNESVFESITAGVRIIADSGHGLSRQLLNKFNKLDDRYLKRVFMRSENSQNNDMKQLFEELTVSDYLKNVYNNKQHEVGVENKAFMPDNPETVIDLPATVVVNGPMGGAEIHINGTLAHAGGTATPPPPLGLDLGYLLHPHHHQPHHHRKVSVKHSVAAPYIPPPHRGSVEGKELNILRGALLQNKLPGAEMVSVLCNISKSINFM